MIHKKKYVKELIRKRVEGALTPVESARLDAARLIYSEEELEEMVIEVLSTMEERIPDDPLDNWEPDFDAIRKEGDRRRTKRWWRKWSGAALVLLPITGLLVYLWVNRADELIPYGSCTGLPSEAVIPVSESSCTVWAGDSTVLQAGSDSYGELLRAGDVLVGRTRGGLLQLKRVKQEAGEPTAYREIVVATDIRQQCVVELPDGTQVRLNAQSSLHYPMSDKRGMEVVIHGEAHVRSAGISRPDPILIRTHNGTLKSVGGDFSLLSMKGYTRASLREGKLTMHSAQIVKPMDLDCYGAQGFLVNLRQRGKVAQRDTMIYRSNGNIEETLRWTKVSRSFKDASLRDFVTQMSRWHGFTVKDINCIPKDDRISASVCYKSSNEEVFAAIRNAGITLYQQKGMISFCPSEKDHRIVFAKEIRSLVR